jgi:hypothetical protein
VHAAADDVLDQPADAAFVGCAIAMQWRDERRQDTRQRLDPDHGHRLLWPG